MVAAVFPGQGSQKPGMGRELAEAYPAADRIFQEVSNSVGRDLRALCWESDEETLRQTDNAQLALYTVGVAAWTVLREAAPGKVSAVAGHSVGEYCALVAAGVFDVEEGALLVQVRGGLMASAGQTAPGAMAAVLGLDLEPLEQACEAAGGVVVVANDNCPGQLVISGERDAVERAGKEATALGAKRVIPLNVSGAFHSRLMAEPAAEMRKALDGYSPKAPNLRIYSNVTSELAEEGFAWPELLERQLASPVRWTESIQHMVRDGVTTFIECGAGDVLTGMIRRIDRSVTTAKVGDPASLAATIQLV